MMKTRITSPRSSRTLQSINKSQKTTPFYFYPYSTQTLKKKPLNKQKLTPEEYKLQNTSVKKRTKKKDFDKGKFPNQERTKPLTLESNASEKKQPLLIIKMVKGIYFFGKNPIFIFLRKTNLENK